MENSRIKRFKRFALLKVSAHRLFPLFSGRIVQLDAYLTRDGNYQRSLVRLGGITPIALAIPGRKTGKVRETRLFAIEVDKGQFAVVGSNWGKPDHPAWSTNLRATQQVSAVVRGKATTVTVRNVEGTERTALWGKLTEAWPNFDIYERRSGRLLRVFLLTEIPKSVENCSKRRQSPYVSVRSDYVDNTNEGF